MSFERLSGGKRAASRGEFEKLEIVGASRLEGTVNRSSLLEEMERILSRRFDVACSYSLEILSLSFFLSSLKRWLCELRNQTSHRYMTDPNLCSSRLENEAFGPGQSTLVET